MDPKKTNLDDYLADLGISEAEDDVPPAPVPTAPAPASLNAPTSSFTPSGTPTEVLERFLTSLTARLDPDLRVSVRAGEDDALEAEITGERAARLAGRDGRVMQAIEVLAYTVLAKQTGRADLRVRVDVGGYRKRHAEQLSRVAERLAVQVAKSGEPHEMQPLPAADRRVIHMTLKEHPDVMTESVGEGTARRLVIRPRHTA
ncbi:protein jag [Deinococcus maricopensis]|uniref:Single-stranded nucleic acid binding R3H domain-containing protein n=1 Tax=Deinococcus maricopensis (strain DSM 21211 / LMG 22137 / NRRL B-23946 / LB-34) TaxID=709986 RepID=E8U6M5_DEIML|nr:R3H domain-containing nucleic acid-binding protein [Deinococcus maricopensis]ADV66714.1 single-stranded nucleic acid binding R3H domain-containing protein [Deinococcus maricopensis DSM 21211]